MLPILLAAALMQSPDLTPSQRGSDLYQSCKTGIALMDSPSGATATTDELLAGTKCQQYISGFLEGNMYGGSTICADTATLGTLMRVYVAYMDANPKVMDEPKSVGVYLALAIAYPCPVKAATPKQSGKK